MVNLVNDLKIVGYVLTDEQQVQVVIHSLQKFWEHMKVLIHLKLEEDLIKATKFSEEVLVAESSKVGVSSSKQKKSHNNSKMNKKK